MNFEFATAARIIFGEGKRAEAIAAARQFGKRALIVTGQNPTRAEWLVEGLRRAGVFVEFLAIPGEPKVQEAQQGAELARGFNAEVVIGIGGGSAIDAGKAIAALANNPGNALDYLEVIGRGKPLPSGPLPFIAIPTTAGTGAEVTRNAVLSSAEHHLKVSLRSPAMLPALAIVDPELTYHLPPDLTASTGMDALTQLIEPFVCNRSNPMTDALCREGIKLAARSLHLAFGEPVNKQARRDLALAALFGGMALANAGLGAVHGFAAPIGGMFPAAHGAVCAALLPHVMRANYERLKRDEEKQARFSEIAQLLTANTASTAQQGIDYVQGLCRDLNIPPLRRWGVTLESVPAICERAAQASSMKANPIAFSREELAGILRGAIE